ncbi:hypothetical protein D1007_61434 [Hordeum vulgare]|nr:hypothetical protein D1007_61434 [Hordeum vulgare]
MGLLRGYLVMPSVTSPSLLEPIQLYFLDCGGSDAAIAFSPEAVGQASFTGAEDDEVGALAPYPEAMKSIPQPIFDRDAMLARIDEAVFVKMLGRLLASSEEVC